MGILEGQTIKSPGNVMNCRDNNKKNVTPGPSIPTQGDRSVNFRGSTNQKSEKCHELPIKVIQNLTPTPPGIGSFMGTNFKCLGYFMNCRENRYFSKSLSGMQLS